jgi:hypothetical protein
MPDFPRPGLIGIDVKVSCNAVPWCSPDAPCEGCLAILEADPPRSAMWERLARVSRMRPADMADAEYLSNMERCYRRVPDYPAGLLDFMGMTGDEYAAWIMHGAVPERVMRVAGRRGAR